MRINYLVKCYTYWLALISFRTCSKDSKKNRSSSVLWSKIFLASRLTLFISLVLRSITLWSLASSILAASFSVLACCTMVRFSVLNSLDIWLKDFSKVWIFSVNCEINNPKLVSLNISFSVKNMKSYIIFDHNFSRDKSSLSIQGKDYGNSDIKLW